MDAVVYRQGNDLDLDSFIELYRASTLGERRPIDNRAVMKAMLEHGDLTLTAWDGDRLIGLARTLTDFAYVAYLADLAVHLDYQKRGIGRELIRRTQAALEPTCSMVLLSAPEANAFYPKIGFTPNPRAWTLGPPAKP